ncbi:hypothetical protein HK096_000689, partial [Nowakowskiella sp. JEL0078]
RVRLRSIRQRRGVSGLLLRIYDASQAWILVFIVGAVTGWLASYVAVGTEWLGDIREGYCSAGFYLNQKFCCWQYPGKETCDEWISWGGNNPGPWLWGYIVYVSLALMFSAASSAIVLHYAPYAVGSGIPEIKTILGGFVIKNYLGGRTLLCVGSILAIASGLSLGQEEPLVHIACCVGNIISRIFSKYARNEARKREILSASSAAGISVAFGAPIGGVLFSLEEVSSYFPYKTMWRSFFCAMIAAISLQLMDPFRTGNLVLALS